MDLQFTAHAKEHVALDIHIHTLNEVRRGIEDTVARSVSRDEYHRAHQALEAKLDDRYTSLKEKVDMARGIVALICSFSGLIGGLVIWLLTRK